MKQATAILKRIRSAAGNERGFSIAEALVAIAIIAIVVTGFIATYGTGSLAVRTIDAEAELQRLARNQLEYIKSYTYDPVAVTYPLLATPPEYAVIVVVSPLPATDSNIQKISVTVTRDDRTLTVADYKVNR
jgi:type II secretory pathway pseudopilin PulG